MRTCAVAAVWSQNESGLAYAFEAAVFIDAHPIQTHVRSCTFIMVCGRRQHGFDPVLREPRLLLLWSPVKSTSYMSPVLVGTASLFKTI